MTLRVTPWGKDDFKATSEEAESKDWAYWQKPSESRLLGNAGRGRNYR